MALDYSRARKGAAAIEDAATQKSSGGGGRFVPEIFWREDEEQKFILILTPIDEVLELDLHEWIPVGKGEKANGETYTRYESFLSRKDPLLEEDYDRIEDDLGRAPKTRCMGVGVELEPVMETRRGRQRPKGFSAKTGTYTRNTDDGEVEVTQPLIGLIIQSSQLMWSPLTSTDKDQGPLDELPLSITRKGTDRNTHYVFAAFEEIPVDLGPVTEYVDGISYLSDELGDIIADMESTENDLGAAQAIARALMTKRIDELADEERYHELVDPLDEVPDRFGKSKKAKGKSSRPSRPARPSQRPVKAEAEDTESSTEESSDAEPNEAFKALKARVESGT